MVASLRFAISIGTTITSQSPASSLLHPSTHRPIPPSHSVLTSQTTSFTHIIFFQFPVRSHNHLHRKTLSNLHRYPLPYQSHDKYNQHCHHKPSTSHFLAHRITFVLQHRLLSSPGTAHPPSRFLLSGDKTPSFNFRTRSLCHCFGLKGLRLKTTAGRGNGRNHDAIAEALGMLAGVLGGNQQGAVIGAD
ncbi:unnamed protein product [Vicia faba]|uniref:Uncharacterized protein n=1 Tax=Vicia faba TaxID=3906 RepID=A0AAV0YMX1_VICFA|nr:unnamed protein product [Vicia faba]